MEVWKPVVGFEGLYEVSNLGRLKSCNKVAVSARKDGTTRLLNLKEKPKKSFRHRGYEHVLLNKDAAKYHCKVHSLVMHAFVGPRPEGMQVCHNNGVRHDNRLENLRYDTQSGNRSDMISHGTSVRGERTRRARLTESQVRKIRALYASGVTQRELAAEHGVARTTIAGVVQRATWTHV